MFRFFFLAWKISWCTNERKYLKNIINDCTFVREHVCVCNITASVTQIACGVLLIGIPGFTFLHRGLWEGRRTDDRPCTTAQHLALIKVCILVFTLASH